MVEVALEEPRALLEQADQHFDNERYADALLLYRECLRLSPQDPEALTGEALSLLRQGRFSEAAPLLEALQPIFGDSVELKYLYGDALYRLERYDEAGQQLAAALALAPERAELHNRLGSVHQQLGRNEEANRCFLAALRIEPDNVEALCNLGMLMVKYCHYADAERLLLTAFKIDPASMLVLNNLGRVCKMQGRHAEAVAWFRKALEVDPACSYVIDNYLFTLNYCDGLAPDYVASEHIRLSKGLIPSEEEPFDPPPRKPAAADGKIRIGYVSGDFYTHSVSYFVEPVLQHHNYDRFEIVCYSVGSNNDATTGRIRALPCRWRNMTGCSHQDIARQVREDDIDILVDLAGHTADNRLGAFALRPAPIQVSWVGYPNTTGLRQMDFYLTDAYCDPVGQTERFYTERLWRLPRVFCCYLPPVEFPPVTAPPFLVNGYITLGSFNNFAKVTPRQLDLWAEIMALLPDSRLYLKSMALGDDVTKERVLAHFRALGIEDERVMMRTVTSTPLEHLAEYSRVDIALDTFPYHGTTTTCEALWMGVPVVTLAGTTHVSRVGVSLFENIGCLELIARSEDDYLQRTVALAADRERLTALRERLRGMLARSPLMDAAGVTREVEAAYEAMFAEACRKAGDL